MSAPSAETSDNPNRNPDLPPGFEDVRYHTSQPGIALAIKATLAFYSLGQRETADARRYTSAATKIAAVLDMVEPVDGGRDWFSQVGYAHRLQRQGVVDQLPEGWEERLIEELPLALASIAGPDSTEQHPPAAAYQTQPERLRVYDTSNAGPNS